MVEALVCIRADDSKMGAAHLISRAGCDVIRVISQIHRKLLFLKNYLKSTLA